MRNPELTKYHIRNIIAAFFMVASLGFVFTSYSFLLYAVTDDLGFTVAEFSIHFSLITMTSVLGTLIWTTVINKLGVQKTVIISASIACCGIVMFAFCKSLTAFYIAASIVGIGVPGCSMLPASILINTWFVKGKGTIQGIVAAANNVAGIILSASLGPLLLVTSWQNVYLIMALGFFMCNIPFSLLISEKPEDRKTKAYGALAVNIQENQQRIKPKLYKLPKLYVLYLAFIMFSVTTAFTYQIPLYLKLINFSVFEISLCASAFMVFAIINKFFIGYCSDKIGVKLSVLFVFLALASSLFILSFAPSSLWLILPALFLYSFGAESQTIVMPLCISKVFDAKSFGSAVAIIMTGSALGATLGAPLWSSFVDKHGTHINAMPYMAMIGLFGIFLILLSLKKSKETS